MHPSLSEIEEHFALIEAANSRLQPQAHLFPTLADIFHNLDTAIQTFRRETLLYFHQHIQPDSLIASIQQLDQRWVKGIYDLYTFSVRIDDLLRGSDETPKDINLIIQYTREMLFWSGKLVFAIPPTLEEVTASFDFPNEHLALYAIQYEIPRLGAEAEPLLPRLIAYADHAHWLANCPRAISTIQTPTAVEYLFDVLDNPPSRDQEGYAFSALLNMRDFIFPALMRRLATATGNLRLQGVRLLGWFPQHIEITLPYIMNIIFKETDAKLRRNALGSVSSYLCPFYEVPIDEKSWLVLNLAMALEYEDEKVRQLGEKCLALLEQVELVPQLLELLNNPNESRDVRAESASILGDIARPADLILPSLLQVLKNRQEYETLRSRCAIALTDFRNHREMIVAELENLLPDEQNEWVREEGILRALEYIREG
jgi:hypothetical protein